MANINIKNLAKRIVENTSYDPENKTLFVAEPGISFQVLKNLAKKHGFTIGQVKSGEYVSIPSSFKYTKAEALQLYDDFLNTYTLFDKNYDTLKAAYAVFDSMDENMAEISMILDTYTAEVLSQGFVDDPLKIHISNSNAQDFVEKVLYKNKIFQRLPSIVRAIAKYGNLGLVLQYPYLENWINDPESVEFKQLDVVEDLLISFVNPKYFKVNVDEFMNPINYETMQERAYVNLNTRNSLDNKTWQPWQFVHFKIDDELTEPYGKSMLWSMRSAYDQLTTLEALLGISRASNIQRLVFTVPLPNGINMIDAYGFLNEFRNQYLNSIFTDYGAAKAGRKLPGAMSILTLPESHDGKKVTVDSLEAKIDLGSTDDVEYFLDKILRSSALPKGYLVGDDTITTAQALEAQDLKLKRFLIPLKQAFLTGMMTLIENILAHGGYDVTKMTVDVGLNEAIQIPADTIEKYNDIGELLKSFIELNPQMPDINKFQFLLKMGLPTDLASLVCSKTSINVLDVPEDLGKFLLGQKIKNGTKVTEEDNKKFGESVKYSISSKTFVKQNPNLARDLSYISSGLKADDRKTLIESCFIAKATKLKEDGK